MILTIFLLSNIGFVTLMSFPYLQRLVGGSSAHQYAVLGAGFGVLAAVMTLARATGDALSLDYARRLFHDIETHSRDHCYGGYLEACSRDWRRIADMRLSDKDENEAKTMNTHLHIIEPYVNLYQVWPDAELKGAIEHLLHLFFDVMEDRDTHHLGLFYDEQWHRQDRQVSYGHDIEASWLLLEAAQVIGDKALIDKALAHTAMIAHAALEGRLDDGSINRTDDKTGFWKCPYHNSCMCIEVMSTLNTNFAHGQES